MCIFVWKSWIWLEKCSVISLWVTFEDQQSKKLTGVKATWLNVYLHQKSVWTKINIIKFWKKYWKHICGMTTDAIPAEHIRQLHNFIEISCEISCSSSSVSVSRNFWPFTKRKVKEEDATWRYEEKQRDDTSRKKLFFCYSKILSEKTS